MIEPNNTEVICPQCCHQFRAIPVQVQQLMLAAGFEPPFTAPPAPTAGNEPAALAALRRLHAAANEIHGELDRQTYDEKRRAEWDVADGHTFSVDITAAQDCALTQAIIVAEAALSGAAQPEPSLPCGHPTSLMLMSAETGLPLYCEYCDTRDRRNDAEQCEQELQAKVAELQETCNQLSRALREEVEGQTFMGEPVMSKREDAPSKSIDAMASARLLDAMARNYGDGPHCWDHLDKKACAEAAAAIRSLAASAERAAQAPVGAVPAGWKLVPETPTQEMCQQGQWKAQEWPKFPLRISPIYQAMLAASPTAPQAPESKDAQP